MKDFKEFLKEFKQLNPKLSRSELEKRAKEAYDSEKKAYKESLTIIKVPSIQKFEKEKETKQKETEPEKPKEPEKTPEEIAKEKKEAEEKIAKEKRTENVQKVLELWSSQLQRSIEGAPFPQFPLHPTTRRLSTPTDLYHLIDTIQEDEMAIEPPALLTLLVSDQNICIDCYRAFLNNPVEASNKLAKYFQMRNIMFRPEFAAWQSPMMPPLKREFITFAKGSCKQFMPITLNLDEDLSEKIEKSPLDNIHSLHDLIEKINKEPEVLQKVSDQELQFYGILPDKAMEIRKIAGEKKNKRDKMLKELIKEIIEKNKENKTPEEQKGGGKKEEVKIKRNLALYASMLL